jgi:hypothetical protein
MIADAERLRGAIFRDQEASPRGLVIMRGNSPTIAWFKDPTGNILSVLEAD